MTPKPKRSNSYALACHSNWAYDADEMDAYVATLTARCEALENALADEQTERDMHSDAAASAIKENVALRARCEALTAERDRLAVAICPSGSVVDVVGLEALAQAHRIDSEGVDEYLDTGDETNLSGAYHAGAQAIRSRCQHLEQAVRALIEDIPAIGTFYGITERLASLLPSQEEGKAPDICGWDGPDANGMSLTLCGNWVRWHPTFKFCPHCGRSLAGTVAILRDLGPITDENRVSFAAGYSQALDDQAKGLK